MTFVLDDDTSLTWSTEFQKDRFRLYQGIPAINGDPFAINRNTFTGNPNGDVADYTSYRNTLTFEKILNDNWTMKVGEMSLWYNTPSTTTFLDNATLNGAGFISNPSIFQDQTVANPFMEQNHDLLETLAGEFDTWGVEHKMVLGAEQDWFITNHDTFTTTSTTNLTTFAQGSAFGPINTAGGGPFPLVPNVPPGTALTQNVFDNPSFRQNRFGFFGQDVIDLTDRLHVLGGARFDYMTQEYARSDTTIIPALGGVVNEIGPTRTYDTFNHFSPRVGLTYDLIPDTMSAYAMYSKSFTPSVGVANFSAPTPLLPEIGDIWEGGFKTQLSDKFALRTSGYWIKEHNINVEQFNPTPGAALPFFFTQAGLQRSQGVEGNLTGQLTERLTTISNVSYNDSYLYNVAQGTVGSTPPIEQTRVRGVPHWLGNLWLRYNFIQEQRRTVGMALGMRYVGNRVGDYSSPLILPSYNVWDLGFFYQRGNLNGMILWDNIFNDNYIVSSLSQYQVIPGTPSNVRLQFSYLY
jgi:iron complex outermembrane receptor protein